MNKNSKTIPFIIHCRDCRSMKDLFVFRSGSHSSPSLSKDTVRLEEDDSSSNSLGSISSSKARSLGESHPESPIHCKKKPRQPSAKFMVAPKAEISARDTLVDQLKERPKVKSLKHKPICLFLNHLGTRRVSKVALQAAACEAILETESRAFDDPECSFRIPEEVFCPMKDNHWTSHRNVSAKTKQSRGQTYRSFSASNSRFDCEPTAMSSGYFTDRNGSHMRAPKDQKQPRAHSSRVNDFIGIPDHSDSLPVDHTVMNVLSGYPVEVPSNNVPQDFLYPSESPHRRSNVIEVVGPPTDLFVDASSDDPDAAGIGFVIPPFPSAGPSQAKKQFSKKRVTARKCRSPVVKTSSYPRTHQSPQFRRRVSYALSTPYSSQTGISPGSTTASPMTTTRTHQLYPATVSPYQPPRTSTKLSRYRDYEATASSRSTCRVRTSVISSTKGGPPYRRQSCDGLSLMPYGLAQPFVTSQSKRVRFSNPY